MLKIKPRFFTPTEIARLHHFPIDQGRFVNAERLNTLEPRHFFSFPENITKIQRYKLLGNSLNVSVVACLMRIYLWPDTEDKPIH